MVNRSHLACCGWALLATACGAPVPPTGGGVAVTAGAFGRGQALVMSDYQSTNVALLDCEGRTLAGSFLSSASANSGLSSALSGDVVLPNESQNGLELALIDRYPAAVVTWVNLATGSVSAQLDVSTGFRANPQDLAVVGPEVWISRYETNPKPGRVPYDGGGDVLVVERETKTITGRIDLTSALADAPGFFPRPGKMARLKDRLYVLLAAYDMSFANSASSRIVELDIATRQLVATHILGGLAGCTALALEPPFDRSGRERPMPRLLVGCSGDFHGGSTPTLAGSGLVMLTTERALLHEVRRWTAAELGGRPVGFDLAVDEENTALVTTMGHLGSGKSSDVPDALVEVELEGPTPRVVFETDSLPFELGGIRCTTAQAPIDDTLPVDPASPRDCFVADGERGVLRRLVHSSHGYDVADSIFVENAIGLPPRWMGRF